LPVSGDVRKHDKSWLISLTEQNIEPPVDSQIVAVEFLFESKNDDNSPPFITDTSYLACSMLNAGSLMYIRRN
jgi:hypothetical protein